MLFSILVWLACSLPCNSADADPQQPQSSTQPADAPDAMEDQQTLKLLDQLTDRDLDGAELAAFRQEMDRVKKADATAEFDAKLDGISRSIGERYDKEKDKLSDQSKRIARSRYSNSSDKNALAERQRALSRNNLHKSRTVAECRQLADILNRVGNGFAAATVCCRYRQQKTCIQEYRTATHLLGRCFPSPAEIKSWQAGVPEFMYAPAFPHLQGLLRRAIVHHETTLNELVQADPVLAVSLLDLCDAALWRVKESMDHWQGHSSLFIYRGSLMSPSGKSTLLAKTTATAWAELEFQGVVPDHLVPMACRWLDEYTRSSYRTLGDPDPYGLGAEQLRARQQRLSGQ